MRISVRTVKSSENKSPLCSVQIAVISLSLYVVQLSVWRICSGML